MDLYHYICCMYTISNLNYYIYYSMLTTKCLVSICHCIIEPPYQFHTLSTPPPPLINTTLSSISMCLFVLFTCHHMSESTQCICVCACVCIYISSPIDKYLVCFHILAIINNAAVNVGSHISFQISVFIFSDKYSEEE